MGKPAALEIVKYPDDAGYYLFYNDQQGEALTDTYHLSLEVALAHAEIEFQVRPSEWELPRPS